MFNIEEIKNILSDFQHEFENDKFATIKNIDEYDYDHYSGDFSTYVESREFNSEYEKKYERLYDFVNLYDSSDCYWMDLDIIADANPASDSEDVQQAFKNLQQFLNKIEENMK